MRNAVIISVLLAVATGCAGASDDAVSGEEDLSTVALGVDTNGATLDLAHAKSQGIGFVGRYISFDGTHPALTLGEAQAYHQAGMPLVAIWEIDQQRAFQETSIAGQHQLGASDGKAANTALQQAGGGGHAIYFTIDYDITPEMWKTSLKDSKTGKDITVGDLVFAYFGGIDSVIGAARAGAYGTYTTLHALFDQGLIHYGWQQTFGGHQNDPRDKRAQLRQYDIYPDQTGWGVSGAGALDLDRAVHGKFGQW
ncbi:MAG TPA: glycoside hydrolase domain-containing protein [Polyangiaceae bacterium]|jgi:hypothetical protein